MIFGGKSFTKNYKPFALNLNENFITNILSVWMRLKWKKKKFARDCTHKRTRKHKCTGHSGQWFCIESTATTATEAHDPTKATSGHTNPISMAMLCSRRTLVVDCNVENSSSAITLSTTIVSIQQTRNTFFTYLTLCCPLLLSQFREHNPFELNIKTTNFVFKTIKTR